MATYNLAQLTATISIICPDKKSLCQMRSAVALLHQKRTRWGALIESDMLKFFMGNVTDR